MTKLFRSPRRSSQLEDRSRLAADRERLRAEVKNLIGSIAAGVPAETVALAIRARELEISRLEVRLRAPSLFTMKSGVMPEISGFVM